MKVTPHSLIIVLFVMILAGCQFFEDNPRTALFLIDQGISRFIEAESDTVKRAQRAKDTRTVVAPVLALASKESVTISQLESYLYAQFDIDRLQPSDQRLVIFLVDDVKDSLQEGITGGLIDDKTRLRVQQVLETIMNAALIYL
jgi:hypothetical protein